MKFKSYLLAAALLLGGAGAAAVGTSVTLAADEPAKVDAYNEGDVYELVGDLKGYSNDSWTIGQGFDFTLTKEYDGKTYFYMEVYLLEDDQFKIVNSSNASNPWDIKTADDSNARELISNNGNSSGNFVVKKTGVYEIAIDKHLENDDNYLTGYKFTYLSEAQIFTVSLIGADGQVALEDEANNFATYSPSFLIQDGYVNEGWYLDASFEEPYTARVLDSSITLYGKWVEAGPDTVVYFEGTYTYAYYWNEYGNTDKTWPGIELANSEQATVSERHYVTDATVWKIIIPAEVQAVNIKFSYGEGKEESNNYVLVDGAVYTDVGIDEDKTNAMIFLAAFDELRDENGDICGILEDSAKYEEVKGLYNTIQDKTLVDSLEDLGATIKVDDEYQPVPVTIGDTMNYLLVTRGTDVGTGAGLIGSFQKNASDWIAIVSIAAVSVAAAGLFFFIRKKKSAK